LCHEKEKQQRRRKGCEGESKEQKEGIQIREGAINAREPLLVSCGIVVSAIFEILKVLA
jgi:hypothetical protein